MHSTHLHIYLFKNLGHRLLLILFKYRYLVLSVLNHSHYFYLELIKLLVYLVFLVHLLKLAETVITQLPYLDFKLINCLVLITFSHL
jgi:hypothetical protein